MGASIGAHTRDGARQWVRREEPTADMKPPGDPEILVAHEGNEYHPFGPDRGHLTHVRGPSVGFLRRPWRLMSCGKKKAFFAVGEMWVGRLCSVSGAVNAGWRMRFMRAPLFAERSMSHKLNFTRCLSALT